MPISYESTEIVFGNRKSKTEYDIDNEPSPRE
jgi:hypothetical protein